MKFSRQEHWSGLSFHSPENLPDPGIKPQSPALQADSLPSEPPYVESFSLQSANMESYITLQKQRSYGGRSLSQIQHTLRGQGIHLGVTFWELPWGVSVTVCPPASKDSHPSICKYIHSIPRALKNHPITSLFFPGSSDSKESACNAGDWDSIPGLGRSLGKENGTHSSILA